MTDSSETAALSPVVSASPSKRAWLRFRRNRLGFWSLVIFCVLVVVSLCAELVSNDRPLVVRYEGQTYFPIAKDYSEKTFGGDFETNTDYLDPFIREQLAKPGNWAIFAVNPYGPKTLNYFAKSPNPSAPTGDNWLGTDDRGRDLLAQLIYGFRVSVLFALALTVVGVLLGIITGALQGFFGGKTDLAFQRFIEIWGSMPELYLLIIFSAVFAPSIALLLILLSLFGWMGLSDYVRRVLPQPQPRLRARGAGAGCEQLADHLAAHLAQQLDARRHVFAVSHEWCDSGAHLAGFFRPGRAARNTVAGRIALPRQKQHRRLVDFTLHLRRAGNHLAAAHFHG